MCTGSSLKAKRKNEKRSLIRRSHFKYCRVRSIGIRLTGEETSAERIVFQLVGRKTFPRSCDVHGIKVFSAKGTRSHVWGRHAHVSEMLASSRIVATHPATAPETYPQHSFGVNTHSVGLFFFVLKVEDYFFSGQVHA